MNANHLKNNFLKRLIIVIPIVLLLCFILCITAFTQTTGQAETKKSIEIINPRPVFSLRLNTVKGDRANYTPGERMSLSFQSSKDAYVTIYQYDYEGRVRVIFPNQSNPLNFVRGGRMYQVENIIPPDSQFGPGYIQGFATTRPLLMRDRYPEVFTKEQPVISFNLGDFTVNIRGLLNQLSTADWVSSNIIDYQVVRPHYASQNVGRVMAISFPSGAEVYLNNQYYGTTPKRIEDIRTGQHTLEFVMPGYEPWIKTITVSVNRTTQIEANLVPIEAYGRITVTSNQASAIVYIDGREHGKTALRGSFTISNIREGYHELTVIKEGCYTWTQTIRVFGGETLPVYASLFPLDF
jgi:hypothetical protein